MNLTPKWYTLKNHCFSIFLHPVNRISFFLAYAFIWTITWFPLRLLYIISDFFFVLIYYIVGYRKDVVRKNLENSFPEKSKKELRSIERKFYSHLCDSFIEWVYPLHRSAKQMKKHYEFVNPELINQIYANGQGVVGVLGHYGNWEWLSTLPVYVDHKIWAIHQKMKNPYFNKLINDLRSKYGVHMMNTRESVRTLLSEAQKGELTFTYFLADQSPLKSQIKYWTTFLNQDTGVFLGAEQVAKKLNMAVVFMDISKAKRGHYRIEFKLLTNKPKETEPYEITEMHVRELEKSIRRAPAFWLWSHRRWKHQPDKSSDQVKN